MSTMTDARAHTITAARNAYILALMTMHTSASLLAQQPESKRFLEMFRGHVAICDEKWVAYMHSADGATEFNKGD